MSHRLAIGVLLGALVACGDDGAQTRGRGDGEGEGGAASGAPAGPSSASTSTSGVGGDGGAPGGVTVAVASSGATAPSGPSGGDPEGVCRSQITSDFGWNECLETACCTEFDVCSEFGHDNGACAACLQAGGGQRCDAAIGCINRSRCTLEYCSYPNGAVCFGTAPHGGAECVDPLVVCDGVPDCSSGSDELGCEDPG